MNNQFAKIMLKTRMDHVDCFLVTFKFLNDFLLFLYLFYIPLAFMVFAKERKILDINLLI